MATTTDLASLPVPEANDDATVPADLVALAEALEQYLMLRFASAAARDSAWPSAPVGATCYLEDSQRIYVRRPGGWESAAPRITVGTGAPSGGTAGDVYVRVAS